LGRQARPTPLGCLARQTRVGVGLACLAWAIEPADPSWLWVVGLDQPV